MADRRSASAALHFFDALRKLPRYRWDLGCILLTMPAILLLTGYRPYFWLAVVAVLQTVWSNLQGLYYFYW